MTYEKIKKKISNFITNNPILNIGLGLCIAAFFFMGTQNLKTDFGYRIWFQDDNPKLEQFDAFERQFGSDEVAIIAVESPSGIFDKESVKLVRELTEDLWLAPEVIRVDSLSNFNWIRAEGDDIIVDSFIPDDTSLTSKNLKRLKNIAVNHESIEGYLINKNANITILYATIKPAIGGTPDYEKITLGIRKVVEKYNHKGDHKIHLTGNPILNFAFSEATQNDFQKLVPVVLMITVGFLWLTVRRISGVALALLIVALTIIAAMGTAGWIGISINNLTAIVPQFMIAIGVAVSVHILVTFFQFYNRGMEKKDAIIATIEKNLAPTLLTSISTAIGFYSYLTGELPPIIQMGIMAGTATLFSWIFSYLILIPILQLLPLKPKSNSESDTTTHLRPSKRAISVTAFIKKHRIIIISTYAVISLIMIGLTFKITVNSDPVNYFDEKYPMRQATDVIEDRMGGAMAAEIIIDSGKQDGIKSPQFLNKAEKYQKWVLDIPQVTKTVSVIDILKEMNQSLQGGSLSQRKIAQNKELVAQQLFLYMMNLPQGMDINNRVTINQDKIRITAIWSIHDSNTALRLIDEMEEKAKEMGLSAHVTGKMPLYQSNNDVVVSSFVTSMSLAIVLISILLMIGLKSIRMGLFSMIPNSIPLIIGAGLLPLLDKPLDIGTVLVGSICLGIAVDDTIHFITNYQKYKLEGHSTEVAVSKILTYTAPALLVTTLVLVGAFGTFIFGTFVPNQNFGMFVAIILTVALSSDLIFLPALLMNGKESANSKETEQL